MECGIGGFVDMQDGLWYQSSWKDIQRPNTDILWAELIAIVIMFKVCCRHWRHKVIRIYCDNQSVVGILIHKKCCLVRNDLMVFVRMLLNICEMYDIKYTIFYVKTSENPADIVSRMGDYNEFKNRGANKTLAPKPINVDGIFKEMVDIYGKYHKKVNLKDCGLKCDCQAITLGGFTRKTCYFY